MNILTYSIINYEYLMTELSNLEWIKSFLNFQKNLVLATEMPALEEPAANELQSAIEMFEFN